MRKEVYFLNDTDKESAYDVVKRVIKKHFKNNVKATDWDKNLKYILGEDQVLLIGGTPVDKKKWLDMEERIDLFFTIISNDNWKLRCCGVWMENTIDLYEVEAPEGSRFITDLHIDSFLPWELCSNWIRKQYKQLKKRTLDKIEENRNSIKNFLFDKAVKKINQLNNMSEEEMIKTAVVKDDPKPDGEIKKALEKELEKEASDKKNGK